MVTIWQDPAFLNGFWQGAFQLLSLTLVAAFGTLVYQRMRDRRVANVSFVGRVEEDDRFVFTRVVDPTR